MDYKQIRVNPILENQEEIVFKCKCSESIKELKNKISEKLRIDVDDFALFLDFEWLDEEKFLDDYEINESSIIKYCTFTRYTGEILPNSSYRSGNYSEIFQVPGMIIKQYTVSQTTTSLKPLLRELITFLKIVNHPNIIQFLAFYRDDENFYIGMEMMPGGSLAEYIKKNGSLKENDIRNVTKQILNGLQCLHGNKIIFRDLKTSNILLDNALNIKLSGLSVSRYFMGTATDELKQGFSQTKVGTYRYMAPEVSNNERYGVKADVWSLGAVLVEMVTGKPPYPELNSLTAGREIALKKTIPFTAPKDVSADLINFINCCLHPSPEDRLSVDDLIKHQFLNPNLIDFD